MRFGGGVGRGAVGDEAGEVSRDLGVQAQRQAWEAMGSRRRFVSQRYVVWIALQGKPLCGPAQTTGVSRELPYVSVCLSLPACVLVGHGERKLRRVWGHLCLCSPSPLPWEALPTGKLLGRNFRGAQGQVAERWVGPCGKGWGSRGRHRDWAEANSQRTTPERLCPLCAAPVLVNTHIFRDWPKGPNPSLVRGSGGIW